ncbi:hypothetical protein [Sinorhizobium psoraleae]|uniref:Uncharacterized protein n=1 Tax=Sinorhizobium psoraleae TaxID=520838 RepID=A0ABT4KNX6_9HYPH|nr:hypothetical protein [Sinorhizobium psoraleae]MCZ4093534.1 hypothetical protein [Sinorhizobium psoraleae]
MRVAPGGPEGPSVASNPSIYRQQDSQSGSETEVWCEINLVVKDPLAPLRVSDDAAEHSILIGIYDFTAPYMEDLLLAAMARNVKVSLMLDIDVVAIKFQTALADSGFEAGHPSFD